MTWIIILGIVVVASLVFYHFKSIKEREDVISNYAKKIAQLEFDLTNAKKQSAPAKRTFKTARRKNR